MTEFASASVLGQVVRDIARARYMFELTTSDIRVDSSVTTKATELADAYYVLDSDVVNLLVDPHSEMGRYLDVIRAETCKALGLSYNRFSMCQSFVDHFLGNSILRRTLIVPAQRMEFSDTIDALAGKFIDRKEGESDSAKSLEFLQSLAERYPQVKDDPIRVAEVYSEFVLGDPRALRIALGDQKTPID